MIQPSWKVKKKKKTTKKLLERYNTKCGKMERHCKCVNFSNQCIFME